MTSAREHSRLWACEDGAALALKVLNFVFTTVLFGTKQPVLRRRSPNRVAVGRLARWVFVGLYRLAPKVLDAPKISNQRTVIRWHSADLQAYWRWKSGSCGGRPRIAADPVFASGACIACIRWLSHLRRSKTQGKHFTQDDVVRSMRVHLD